VIIHTQQIPDTDVRLLQQAAASAWFLWGYLARCLLVLWGVAFWTMQAEQGIMQDVILEAVTVGI
jgi:hypothetical protein